MRGPHQAVQILLETSFSFMNSMIASYRFSQYVATTFATVADPDTHPRLALMANSPPINRESSPILLSPRPLHCHITHTHDPLPQVIKAVMDMVLLRA